MQSIKFDDLRVQAGSDATGVTTDMITMNSTLKFTYRNTGTFFGVHVTATPVELSYSDIVIASGDVRFMKTKQHNTDISGVSLFLTLELVFVVVVVDEEVLSI